MAGTFKIIVTALISLSSLEFIFHVFRVSVSLWFGLQVYFQHPILQSSVSDDSQDLLKELFCM